MRTVVALVNEAVSVVRVLVVETMSAVTPAVTASFTAVTSEATVAVGGIGAASSEELARNNVYIKYSASGQPTYLGKSPDAMLKPGEAILAKNKRTGAVTVQHTSGLSDSEAMTKFGMHIIKNY